jgi:cellobiose-specific phosphotransferase system component IIA
MARKAASATVDQFLDEETEQIQELLESFNAQFMDPHHHPLSFLQKEEKPVDLLKEAE